MAFYFVKVGNAARSASSGNIPEAKPIREAGAMRGARPAESAKRGVDAFDGASRQHEANCQGKRKSLPKEGRKEGNPLLLQSTPQPSPLTN